MQIVATYIWASTYGHYSHYQVAAWDSCNLSHGVCIIIGVPASDLKLSLSAQTIFTGRTLKGVCLGGKSVAFAFMKPLSTLSVQLSSVAQSCPTLCDPMNRSTPGLPVHHQLPEFTLTQVH